MFTILLVDDDPHSLRLLDRLVESHFGERARTLLAQDARGATNALVNEHVDVLVTDLDMEERNGFHLLKAVKSLEPLTQVVILTAHDSADAIRSAFTMGADDFFVKPYDRDDLTRCLEYLTARLDRWGRTLRNLEFNSDFASLAQSAGTMNVCVQG